MKLIHYQCLRTVYLTSILKNCTHFNTHFIVSLIFGIFQLPIFFSPDINFRICVFFFKSFIYLSLKSNNNKFIIMLWKWHKKIIHFYTVWISLFIELPGSQSGNLEKHDSVLDCTCVALHSNQSSHESLSIQCEQFKWYPLVISILVILI